MLNVSTSELMHEIDQHMVKGVGIPSMVLMENAAHAVTDAVLKCGREGLCAILIGPGNNGGDGLAVLRQLLQEKRDAIGIMLCDANNFKGDALENYRIACRLNLPLTYSLETIERANIIVDAVFGTGLDRKIEGKQSEAILRVNKTSAYRIAVDIPSGINGTSGRTDATVFHADETVTFVALKRGHLLTSEPESVGKLRVANIGMTDERHRLMLENEQLIDREYIDTLLPERKRYSNKGSYGRSLLIVGSSGMSGAAVMAALACVRAGSGLTKAVIPKSIINSFVYAPEIMTISDENTCLEEQIEWANAVCIGCGMGNDEKKLAKLKMVLKSNKKTVLDADAINLLAVERELIPLLNDNHIITPHPAEMARLIGLTVNNVVNNSVDIALDVSNKYGCTVLLKNASSIITSPNGKIRYNISGNTGLAKGGSGDCLSGIITALLAQGLAPFDAASAGAFILGASAESAISMLKTRMLTAGDVIASIDKLICC